MNTEELLKQKMSEGWNIFIECKGKGRGYELTYEGKVYKVSWNLEDKIYGFKFGVGNTIEELIKNMELE
jgi:hypothetical protein